MWFTIRLCQGIMLAFIFHILNPFSADAIEYFVSQSGDDSWSGTLKEPNAGRTDGPFATLARARQGIRDLRRNGPVMPESIIVTIRGGEYRLTESFRLTGEDSGYPHAPVVWRGSEGERVNLTGGVEIGGFQKVTDKAVLKRFGKECRDNIMQADLKALGIADFGDVDAASRKRRELYFKGKFMEIARYPNEGYLKIKDVPQEEGNPVYPGVLPHMRFGIPVGRHWGRIMYDDECPKRWAQSDDIWMHGYWTWDWSAGFVRIQEIDSKKREIHIAEPHHNYGYTKEQRYYYLNILEELDSPGEWYLDAAGGMLYFYPPSEIMKGDVCFPLLEETMVSLENTANVTIENIDFSVSRGGAIEISGGQDNLIAGCTFTSLGKYAVAINGGFRNGITSCDIFEVASGGIQLSGGERKTLSPGLNFARNNHIHHFARRNKTYHYAFAVSGVENRIEHNLIHDAPHIAIGWGGNENIFEFNEIHHVLLETNDAGAIYGGRNPSMQGNIIRHNYFHHIGKEAGHGTNSVYFDDYHCGNFVIGNVFYKGGIPGNAKMGAVFIHAGRYNIIDNNIFIDCPQAYGVSHWNQEAMDRWFPEHNTQKLLHEDVEVSKPPYSERYPWIQNIMEDRRLNVLARNLVYRCGSFIGRGEAVETDNLVTQESPGFIDESSENFMLKDDSWVFERMPGFKKIPFNTIGLYIDEYRKSISKD